MGRPLTTFVVLALAVILSTDGVLGAEGDSAASVRDAQAAAAAVWNYVRSLIPRPVATRPPQATQPQRDQPPPPSPVQDPPSQLPAV